MEHVLLRCNARSCRRIWKEAKRIWPHGRHNWPELSMGLILGIGCINQTTTGRPAEDQPDATPFQKQGKARLLQILISEASHLIWVLRCEKVIRGKTHSNQEISTRWKRKINDRLTTDRITATKIRRDPNYTQLIDKTWKLALRKADVQHQDWLHHQEVFSG